jgi:hypothetical protein
VYDAFLTKVTATAEAMRQGPTLGCGEDAGTEWGGGGIGVMMQGTSGCGCWPTGRMQVAAAHIKHVSEYTWGGDLACCGGLVPWCTLCGACSRRHDLSTLHSHAVLSGTAARSPAQLPLQFRLFKMP